MDEAVGEGALTTDNAAFPAQSAEVDQHQIRGVHLGCLRETAQLDVGATRQVPPGRHRHLRQGEQGGCVATAHRSHDRDHHLDAHHHADELVHHLTQHHHRDHDLGTRADLSDVQTVELQVVQGGGPKLRTFCSMSFWWIGLSSQSCMGKVLAAEFNHRSACHPRFHYPPFCVFSNIVQLLWS